MKRGANIWEPLALVVGQVVSRKGMGCRQNYHGDFDGFNEVLHMEHKTHSNE